MRSYSTEHLPSEPPRPNLLKTSLSSRRSMSVEALTPVYIGTETPSKTSFNTGLCLVVLIFAGIHAVINGQTYL